ncbi:hypothetical protein AVEN_124240-1 [Araneus ventricosus]|uniref:Uncharacterized protein n=1 Tax=Araneus ventricosus TaxID=182803 RepID=A0A4Y2LXK4_ARAVE|nr:hypothetical protein AVEN_124240-1 [Araneus ventricosus]
MPGLQENVGHQNVKHREISSLSDFIPGPDFRSICSGVEIIGVTHRLFQQKLVEIILNTGMPLWDGNILKRFLSWERRGTPAEPHLLADSTKAFSPLTGDGEDKHQRRTPGGKSFLSLMC